ncbi:hypothetical protein M9H77_22037 [Catharanthus roseus]|uniref:Uncharacterized protein n=1 Tax=Catharanthus roseus TaxID=4058 RepID=A0ACC0ARD5_CATRO|nr:hypothetical protein M9H77_22037 [Catharanthus roseus]
MEVEKLPKNLRSRPTVDNRSVSQTILGQNPTGDGRVDLPSAATLTSCSMFRTSQGNWEKRATRTVLEFRKEEHPRAFNLGINLVIELEIVNTFLGCREKSMDANEVIKTRLAAILEQGFEKMVSAPQPLHYQQAVFQDNWQGYNLHANQYSSSWMDRSDVS